MNPQDPLANLHPLREPDLIGWWPLAPGWWLLLVTVLLGLATLAYFLVRRYRANAYRRRALSQLHVLHEEYLADADASRYITRTNALLKSVALRAYPPRQVAANSGEEWLAFLNNGLQAPERFHDNFATAAYQKVCPEMDMAQVHRVTRNWIKRHPVAQ